jgi:hypothetical protein
VFLREASPEQSFNCTERNLAAVAPERGLLASLDLVEQALSRLDRREQIAGAVEEVAPCVRARLARVGVEPNFEKLAELAVPLSPNILRTTKKMCIPARRACVPPPRSGKWDYSDDRARPDSAAEPSVQRLP